MTKQITFLLVFIFSGLFLKFCFTENQLQQIVNGKSEHSKKINDERVDKAKKSSSSSDNYESQSATCNYCGKSFLKSSGHMLSGHSEVFCGSTCATNWAWQHNIGVN